MKQLPLLLLILVLAVACENSSETSAYRLRRDSLRQARELARADSIAALGKWQVASETNPLDDTQAVLLVLDADEGEGGIQDQEAIHLALRCQSNSTEVYIVWHDYLGLDETRVTTRVGKAQARTRTWSISTHNKATFYDGSPIDFIKSLMGADQLIAQTTPDGENPITATFDVRGLDKAIVPLRETCQW